jgi:hypothetical protein
VQTKSDAPHAGNVYLVRGLIGLFSQGIDQLTVDINKSGVRAHVFQEDQKDILGQQILATYRADPSHEPIVLIGHSLGADAVLRISHLLESEGVPVDVVITLDATRPPTVPGNVQICYNYYQPSIFDKTGILRGIPLQQDAGAAGVLYNYNVRKERKELLEWDTNHMNIDKNSRIHKEIIALLHEKLPTREMWAAAHQGPELSRAVPASATQPAAFVTPSPMSSAPALRSQATDNTYAPASPTASR